jgi:hypothetical protein
MKSPFSFLLFIPLWLTAQPETLPESIQDMQKAQDVLAKNFIHITGQGTVGVCYDTTKLLLEEPDVILTIQAAYADLLGEGQEPEFEIQEDGPGTYHYVNQKEQQTRITELYRAFTAEGHLEMVLHTEGERSFGEFRALTYVIVRPCEEEAGLSQWDVQVFAYPESGFSRFFARTFGIAQRYFTRKTSELSELITEICLHVVTVPD